MNKVNSIHPYGTNSTMFTACCDTAISNNQKNCPSCGEPVIGADEETDHKRGETRWRYATRHWNRPIGGGYR